MKSRRLSYALYLVYAARNLVTVDAWISPTSNVAAARSTSLQVLMDTKESTQQQVPKDLEETTEKYGLEAGLFESMKSGNTESAQSLLKRYGIAYLATSIPLALVSFSLCYVLVSNGVDVAGLLTKIGVESSPTGETAGTVAIAYAAHKAASPIRFPPTVLLTPVVAKLIGKEPVNEAEEEESETKTQV